MYLIISSLNNSIYYFTYHHHSVTLYAVNGVRSMIIFVCHIYAYAVYILINKLNITAIQQLEVHYTQLHNTFITGINVSNSCLLVKSIQLKHFLIIWL